jgi:type IV pilus assembly protein PilE
MLGRKEIGMKRNGFSLIELMIAVLIVGILAAIAVPSYSAYVKRANRTDATRSLSATAQALERCYSQNFTYAYDPIKCPVSNPLPVPSSQGYYQITITVNVVAGPPPTETYSLSAVPVLAPQTTDATCTQFTLDSTGSQGATPAGNTQTCWGSS